MTTRLELNLNFTSEQVKRAIEREVKSAYSVGYLERIEAEVGRRGELSKDEKILCYNLIHTKRLKLK